MKVDITIPIATPLMGDFSALLTNIYWPSVLRSSSITLLKAASPVLLYHSLPLFVVLVAEGASFQKNAIVDY